MCQATMGNPCDRCGGGYSMGLDNYCPHEPWCGDDKEVDRRQKERIEREKREVEDWY